MVRDNQKFRAIIRNFDPARSIILYSMWDGYRTQDGSSIPDFLALTNKWIYLHTSGHASRQHLQGIIEATEPGRIVPIHTQAPSLLREICPPGNLLLLKDGEAVTI